MSRALTLFAIGLLGCTAQAAAVASSAQVTLLKTPNSGIQPQAALDAKGVLHLIYFQGKARAGDIFYVRQKPGEDTFCAPLRVNSQPGSATAKNTISGAQLAIGQGNRIPVAWNGSSRAEPKGAGGRPMLYARINDEGTAFEPQRNLITWAGGIDGGGTLAADAKGHVFVAWHAGPEAIEEAKRAVYLSRSSDNGRTFEREKKINTQPTGACGCCQMRAFVDGKGVLYVLYRAAGENVNRDSTLLISSDTGRSFQSATLHRWSIAACPMSSYAFSGNADSVHAAWETSEQIYHASIQQGTARFSVPVAAPSEGKNRKHPSIALNIKGEMLLAWTEGTDYGQGGSLAWQVFDKDGKATADRGSLEEVPKWGLLSAIARPDGSFLLMY